MIGGSFVFQDSKTPILAFSIHNGHHISPELLAYTEVDEATRMMEEDPYTCGFAGLFPNFFVPHASRFAIDLNRSPEKAVYLKPEDAWGLPVRKGDLAADLLERLYKAHEAWYKLVHYQISRLLQTHSHLLILDLHSYNHRRDGMDAPCAPQIDNPDIIIGRSNICREQYPLVESLRELIDGSPFQGGKIDCRCDVKFSGGYFPRWVNATFSGSCLCLAIEFKKTFMNEWTGELNLEAYDELRFLFHDKVMQWHSLNS